MLNRKSFLALSGLALPSLALPNLLTGVSIEQPLLVKASLENSYWYIGDLLSVLLKSADTNGLYSLLRMIETRGFEPPPHTHTREDETFILLNGEMEFSVEGKIYHATAGNSMFLPRNIQHSFKVLTEKSEVLILLTPGGLEQYFLEMSEPAAEMKQPPPPAGPPDIARIITTATKYGVKFPGKK
jgi:mannose-6-phosphate isomerase-like protein (cupin superfamily)